MSEYFTRNQECLVGIWVRVPAELKVFIYQREIPFFGEYCTACFLCRLVGRAVGDMDCKLRSKIAL